MQGLNRQIAGFSKGLWTSSRNQSLPQFKCLADISSIAAGLTRSLHFSPGHALGSYGIRSLDPPASMVQQKRGIRVKVWNGNLEMALRTMQRKMVSSGMERLIRSVPRFHLKDSEKRILAEKTRQKKERSQNLGKKLKTILVQKVRGL